jgi:Protein of unknown function (DUF1553)/Protein of unknown function (DUF1549)/Planctomycete cytochrome C
MRCVWLAFALGFVAHPGIGADGPVRFNRDIRPIMSDTCFRCHGPDQRARMAGLRLDIRDEAVKKTRSGVTPIVPSDPDRSAVVERVFAANSAKIMPPQSAHKELTAAQKEIIRRWIAEGAAYEKHWSYEPVKRAQPPSPNRNAIDAFIVERLHREGLELSPEADRRTLLRRVTFDLTGVPPTPAEMQTFLADNSANAYEKVVDRLLASPRYAEVQTMHWLDAVRYADSAGFHGDNLWPAWPYRDYVLRAFRDNKPFDVFTREQLAGDLLPNATTEQKVASAYNRLNRASAEGGLQPKEYLAKYGADRVRTLSTVWLGSTMGCAECHDHKFDPFSTKDFYSMKAFFADIRETGLINDRGATAWGTKLPLPSPEQQARLASLKKQIDAAQAELKQESDKLTDVRWAWEDRVLAAHKSGELAWRYQHPLSASSAHGAKLTVYNDESVDSEFYLRGSLHSERKRGNGLVVASGITPDNETYSVTFAPGAGSWTAIGIDISQDESLPGNRVSRGADRFVLTEVDAEVSSGGAAPQKLPFVLATTRSFGETPENPPMAAIDGNPKTGWGVGFGEQNNPFLALRFATRLRTTADSVITVRLHHDSDLRRATIGRFRIALSQFENSWPEDGDSSKKSTAAEASKTEYATLSVAVERGLPANVLAALERHEDDRSANEKKLVIDHFAWASPELQALTIRIAKLQAARDLLESSIPKVIYTERTKPRLTRVLPRSNWMDETGEIVQPAVPAFLGVLKTNGRRANRLDLANWIVSPDNPLTARTFVNRQWRQFFGIGLSRTLEDLGSQGEWPTHPELLDWLASEFMRPSAAGAHAWDVKHLIRTIVTSQTYRQSSSAEPALVERDPDNRLLARQSRFRVEAETVHDTALAIAGLLVEKFGGPSVRPYQPDGYLAAVNFPKREYAASRGDDLYRRALYTQWQRTFLHPSLLTFDAPTREECGVNRVNSNTPLQALVLLNDPIFVEAARVFGANILSSGGASLEDQLTWAFERALNRAPRNEERSILAELFQRSLASFHANESDAKQLLSVGEAPVPSGLDPAKLAAASIVARAILNLHETITRD